MTDELWTGKNLVRTRTRYYPSILLEVLKEATETFRHYSRSALEEGSFQMHVQSVYAGYVDVKVSKSKAIP
jgi:hypothetical protein